MSSVRPESYIVYGKRFIPLVGLIVLVFLGYIYGRDAGLLRRLCHKHERELVELPVLRGVYLGWGGHGNLGDDLLYEICSRWLQEQIVRQRPTKFVTYIEHFDPRRNFRKDFRSIDYVILGGGSILKDPYLWYIERALDEGLPVLVFGTGYDDYEFEISKEQINNLRSGSNDFEFNASLVNQRRYQIFARIDHGGIRGPYTENIIRKIEPRMLISSSGDAGILAPHFFAAYEFDEIKELFNWTISRKLVLINIGLTSMYGNAAKLFEILSTAIPQLLDRYDVALYAISLDDLAVLKEFYELVQLKTKEKEDLKHLHLVKEVMDVPFVLGLLKGAYFTINFRLHASVLSASMRIPFIALAYHLKSLEFGDWAGFRNYTLKTDEVTYADTWQAIEGIERNYEGLSNQLDLQYHRVKATYDSIRSRFMGELLWTSAEKTA
jgi:hypothetical protein